MPLTTLLSTMALSAATISTVSHHPNLWHPSTLLLLHFFPTTKLDTKEVLRKPKMILSRYSATLDPTTAPSKALPANLILLLYQTSLRSRRLLCCLPRNIMSHPPLGMKRDKYCWLELSGMDQLGHNLRPLTTRSKDTLDRLELVIYSIPNSKQLTARMVLIVSSTSWMK